MDMVIKFPGGAKVDAQFGPYIVETDQPPQSGGQGTAPTPFATFLASVGTCAGIYVLGFCRQRSIPTEGIEIHQGLEVNPMNGMVSKVKLDIQLPPDFPDKYRSAVIRSADQCAVKKHFEQPPTFEITTNLISEPALI